MYIKLGPRRFDDENLELLDPFFDEPSFVNRSLFVVVNRHHFASSWVLNCLITKIGDQLARVSVAKSESSPIRFKSIQVGILRFRILSSSANPTPEKSAFGDAGSAARSLNLSIKSRHSVKTICLYFGSCDQPLVVRFIGHDAKFQNARILDLSLDIFDLAVTDLRNNDLDLAVAVRTNDNFLVAARVDPWPKSCRQIRKTHLLLVVGILLSVGVVLSLILAGEFGIVNQDDTASQIDTILRLTGTDDPDGGCDAQQAKADLAGMIFHSQLPRDKGTDDHSRQEDDGQQDRDWKYQSEHGFQPVKQAVPLNGKQRHFVH